MSSSLLERVIIAHRCRSTHHYIAIDAIGQISGEDGEKWRDLFLLHHDSLLDGAKAPDTKFKDFKNHVLHVSEGEWGGARDKAAEWYAESVLALKRKDWAKAAYALGVLSHYYSDPIQPLHTGQTEEEGAIHRALEWSVAKSRDTLKARIDEIGYPKVKAGKGAAFVSEMVRDGAEKAHPH
ncbi:MAG: zinc dependent phospholipase C family protein, partial [Pseudomonadota bacterium]